MQFFEGSGGYPSHDKIKFQMKLSHEFYYVSLSFQCFLTLAIIVLFFLNLWNVITQCRTVQQQNQSKQQEKSDRKQEFPEEQSSKIGINNQSIVTRRFYNDKLQNQIIKSVKDVQFKNKSATIVLKSSNSLSLGTQTKKKPFRRGLEMDKKRQEIEIIDKAKLERALSIENKKIFQFQNDEQKCQGDKQEKQDNSQNLSESLDSHHSESQQQSQQHASNTNRSQKISINIDNLEQSIYQQKNSQNQGRKGSVLESSFQQMPNQQLFQDIYDQDQFEAMKNYQKFLSFQRVIIYFLIYLSIGLSVLCLIKINFIAIYGLIPAAIIFLVHKAKLFKKLRWTLHISIFGFIAPAISIFLEERYLY